MIKEVIVVEGRDDEAAVKAAVEAETIATHGYGISKSTWDLLAKAYRERGLIIFTDPDFAGEKIRTRVAQKFPKSKHAYLPREQAESSGDIGIENGSPQHIQEALKKSRCTSHVNTILFHQEEMMTYGLTGVADAARNRDMLGKALGIGYGNAKVFLNRLNQYGVTRQEFIEAWKNYIHQQP